MAIRVAKPDERKGTAPLLWIVMLVLVGFVSYFLYAASLVFCGHANSHLGWSLPRLWPHTEGISVRCAAVFTATESV
jgi:hypothetical protein